MTALIFRPSPQRSNAVPQVEEKNGDKFFGWLMFISEQRCFARGRGIKLIVTRKGRSKISVKL